MKYIFRFKPTAGIIITALALLAYSSMAYASIEDPVYGGVKLSTGISENIIVWVDQESGEYKIYRHLIGAGDTYLVNADTVKNEGMAVWDNKMAWFRNRDGYAELTINSSGNVYPAGFSQSLKKDIYATGSGVFWSDRRSGDFDIYYFDIGTGREVRLSDNSADQRYPVCNGEIVVWVDYRLGRSQLFARNLLTGEEFQLVKSDGEQIDPAIHGNKVVFSEKRGGKYYVYVYDLDDRKEFRISNKECDQRQPAIWGDTIVWADNRNNNWDIYSYNLKTGMESPLTFDSLDQIRPKINGNIVIWQARKDGKWEIFKYDINSKKVINLLDTKTSAFMPQLPYSPQAKTIQVFVNGSGLVFDEKPFIENGRTMVPVRALVESLGCRVEWVASEFKVVITDDKGIAVLYLNNTKAELNNREVILETVPRLVGNRTFVPLRFLSEAMGYKVTWNGEDYSVTVTN